MTSYRTASLRTAIAVNIAKLTLLAALAPPVIAGIAQRSSKLGEGLDTAAIVATTVSLGSVGAIIGALLLGFLADTGSASARARWAWISVATAVGTAGLGMLSTSESRATLTVGWMFAQVGYSGAMAVLRVVLADALPEHRRRGAVIVVLGSYGGLVLPLVMLLLFPTRIWETTFGLALLSLVVPLVMVTFFTRQRIRNAGRAEDDGETGHVVQSSSPISRTWLLVIHFAANLVVTIFLSYHPLELAERAGSEVRVQATVAIVTCAVIGILLSTGVLLWKPALLANSAGMIAFAGALLGTSLVLRAAVESFWLVAFTAFLSGVAVGLNSSALFAAALEQARKKHGGKLMGAYSAAGATGQVIGPMLALGILYLLTHEQGVFEVGTEFKALFMVLALLPFGWAAAMRFCCTSNGRRHPLRER